jgi:fibronectin-binding autotransporter adhesin
MTTVIKLKRGTTTPTTSNIVSGEIAVDTSAQKLYINDNGTVKEIGGVGIPSVSDISDLTATATELNYTDGVTSNIQTQLDAKLPLSGGTMSGIIAGFQSTGIDDNASSTAVTIDSSGNLTMAATQGPALMNEDASNTNPTLIPRKTDTATGWGSNGANNLEGIVGSVRSVLFGAAATTFYASGGSEVARIDRSSGNVGIGTSTVATNLHVYENTNNGTINNIALLDAGNQNPGVAGSGVAMDFRSNSGSSYFGAVGGYSDGTNYVAGLWGGAAASGAPDLVVNSSGNVAVGTTTADAAVTVYKSADSLDGVSIRQNSAGSSAGARLKFGNNSDVRDAEIVLTGSGNSSYAGARTLNFVSNIGGFGFYRGYTTPVATMVLDSSGRVGIGTSTLNGTLLVIDQNGADAPATTGNMNTGSFLGAVSVGGSALNIGHDANGTWYNAAYFNNAGVARNHRWLVGGGEAMRIDSGGKLSVGGTTGAGRLNAISSNWSENALAIYSANVASQTNFAGIAFYNQDTDSAVGNVADIYTNPAGTLSLTSGANPAIQLKYGSGGISGGTAALTVDSSGRIGIGTASPSYLTHLYSTSAEPKLVIEDASSGAGRGGIVTGTWGGNGIRLDSLGAAGWVYVGGGNTSYIPFTIGTEKARFHNNGNFGLGTTSPSYKLHVVGDINYTGTLYNNGVASGSPAQVLIKNSSGTTIKVRVGLNAGGTTTNIKNSAGTALKTVVGPFVSGDATF